MKILNLIKFLIRDEVSQGVESKPLYTLFVKDGIIMRQWSSGLVGYDDPNIWSAKMIATLNRKQDAQIQR